MMKNTILLCTMPILSITSAYADLSVRQIEHMIQKIHLKREGVDLDTLERTKEPFIRIVEEENTTVIKIPKVEDEEDVKISLHAIMSGKAFINDAWKKENDVVLGYTVKYIGKRGVVLQNGNRIKKLFLRKRNKELIIFDERE